ncbi:FAD-dependent oxidoreductase [Aurantiacibacter rhizosphaerae]|uniref:FAD-dependent oxidoreductase n=1 Tax=Aurantiacibacter rhizosphaerae TaxID=2691582 RepID=A0A844XDC9_9SPHN|nr:FAD-dependent oxidoreductase [Aurantiacibacter rhizosphaerae]
MKAIVVGGGLAGLGAAYRLHKNGWEVTVLEADEEVGGRAKMIERNGYSIPTGATQVSTGYHDYIALCKELGVDDDFVAGSNMVSLIRDGKLYEIDGTKPLTVALTGALSLRSKYLIARSMMEMRAMEPKLSPLDMSANHAVDDGRTAKDFAMERMNQQSYDVLVDPLMRACTLNRGDAVSALEWFSALSTLGGVKFITLRGGVQRLSHLLAAKVDTRVNARVTDVKRTTGGVEVNFTQDGVPQSLTADACVLATRLPEAVEMSEEMAEVAKPLASRIEYNRGFLVHLGYSVKPKTRSVGVMVPTVENPYIALIWLEHNKGEDDITPPGHGLFTVYFDEAALDDVKSGSDEEYGKIAADYLEKLYPELKGHQDMMAVSRWNLAIPHPTPGHYRAVNEMKGRIDPAGPIQLAGDYFTTTGQNSAIHWGQRAADNIIKHIGRRNAPAESLAELKA